MSRVPLPEGLDPPTSLLDAVRAAYGVPPRHYHTWDHVEEVLRHWREVDAEGGWRHPRETWLAALYHDAIYEAGRPDNELRSAALARDHLSASGLAQRVDVDRVAHLIALTALHGRHERVDDEEALFLDCDMAVLGGTPAVFDAYDRGIAAEYLPVIGAERYGAGRSAFVAGLLARSRIFLSDRFHDRFDAQARANLRRCLGRTWGGQPFN